MISLISLYTLTHYHERRSSRGTQEAQKDRGKAVKGLTMVVAGDRSTTVTYKLLGAKSGCISGAKAFPILVKFAKLQVAACSMFSVHFSKLTLFYTLFLT
jgi:hypothetical protein